MLHEIVLGREEVFILGLLAAGIVGGCATLLGAYSVEKFGGVVGGIAGTLPLTIIPFIIGLLVFESSDRVDFTLNMVPAGMLDTMIVLFMWRFLPPHFSRNFTSNQRLLAMVLLSLFLWTLLASGFVVLLTSVVTSTDSYWFEEAPIIAGGVALGIYLLISIFLIAIPKLPVGRKGDERVKGWHHVGRFVIGSVTTSISVIIAKYSAYAGGVSISFPAVSLTALASLWIVHSDTVAMSAAAPMIVGSASTSIFAVVFAWAFPILQGEYGKIGGAVVTFASVWFFVVFIYSVPALVILRRKEVQDTDSVERMILPSGETDDYVSSSSAFLINSVQDDEERDFFEEQAVSIN